MKEKEIIKGVAENAEISREDLLLLLNTEKE